MQPSGLFGHPEDAGGTVFVGVLWIGSLGSLGLQLGVLGLEGVGDVFQEDEAEDDVLVLGSVHVVAQRVGCGPQLRFKPNGSTRTHEISFFRTASYWKVPFYVLWGEEATGKQGSECPSTNQRTSGS
jgi:hypothetical protein